MTPPRFPHSTRALPKHWNGRGKPRKASSDGQLTERAWQHQVTELARRYGWRYYHTFDSRRSTPGFPDLILVKGTQLIAAELKVQRNKPTPDQEAWLTAFQGVPGCHAVVWRPGDLTMVVRVLAGGLSD